MKSIVVTNIYLCFVLGNMAFVCGQEAVKLKRDKCPPACLCKKVSLNNVTRWKVTCQDNNYWNTVPYLPRNTILLKMQYSNMPILRNGSFTKATGRTLLALNLKKNRFTGIVPGAFRNLNHLKKLSLKFNSLASIPNGTFSDIANLSILSLGSNQFKEMPVTNMCLLKHLEIFTIAKNMLTSANFDECFTLLQHLNSIDLSSNKIGKVSSEDLYALRNSKVTTLSLNQIGLTNLNKDVFKYLPQLNTLNLKMNKLTHLPSDILRGFPTLRKLYLDGNKFRTIPSEAISEVSGINSFSMNRNLLTNSTLGPEFLNMTYLNEVSFNGNRFISLTNNSFINLKNSRRLVQFSIRSDMLKYIETDTFLPLKYLKGLFLNENRLNASLWEQAFYGLRYAYNLSALQMGSTNMTGINSNTFQYLVNTSITTLHLEGSLMQTLRTGSFRALSKLQDLFISGNNIDEIEKGAFGNLSNLDSVDMTRNKLVSIPDANKVGFTGLKRLILDRNRISGTISPVWLRGYHKLIQLSLTGNNIRSLSPRAFQHMMSLSTLRIANNKLSYLPTDVFYGLNKLLTLDLKGNQLVYFDTKIFTYAPNIEIINLSKNDHLTAEVGEGIAELFKPLRNLTNVFLAEAGISFLPDSTFRNLTKLSIVALSNNELTNWSPGLFRDQSQLSILSLAKNKITTIHEDSIEGLQALRKLAVASNIFVCDCELLWFINWIKSGTFVYIVDLNSMTCGSPPNKKGTKLADLNMDKECMTFTFYIVYLSILSTHIFSVTLMTLMYRFRWYLRYWLHLVKTQKALKDHMGEERFVFDAFVSYTYQDRKWVVRDLLQKVEKEGDIKLCLHERNWLVGSSVPGNILNSIKKSRKTVLVLSNAFARSYWCDLELAVAQQRILTSQRDVVVPILLEPIRKRHVTEQMVCLFATQTPIKWPPINEKKQRKFWRKLIQTLRAPEENLEYDEDNKEFLRNIR